jgi:hypothetical protein
MLNDDCSASGLRQSKQQCGPSQADQFSLHEILPRFERLFLALALTRLPSTMLVARVNPQEEKRTARGITFVLARAAVRLCTNALWHAGDGEMGRARAINTIHMP